MTSLASRCRLEERAHHRGDSLIEVLVAITLIGGIILLSFTGLTVAAKTSRLHRGMATADGVLRDYAEAVKAAVQRQCVSGAPSYTVSYVAPTGYSVNALGAQTCPPAATASAADQPWPPLSLTVAGPDGLARSMSIVVRTS
jgi:hypothetical protein